MQGKTKLLKFISNVSQNLVRKSPRYSKYTKQLYECLRILGGPGTARFLANNLGGPSDDTNNLGGPSDDTQRRTKRESQFSYYPAKPSPRVFQHLASIYTSIKENKNIKGDILVETAEDETVIMGYT